MRKCESIKETALTSKIGHELMVIFGKGLFIRTTGRFEWFGGHSLSAKAQTAALVTGCDPKDLEKQLRAHHEKHGLPENTRLRADPSGFKSPPPGTQMGTMKGVETD
jgi:hypothetical protein